MNLQLSGEMQEKLQHVLQNYPDWNVIIRRIAQAGGVAYLVGGAVRDLFLGLPIKDLDIEVHGLSVQKLQSVLEQFGSVDSVGKAFGVLRVHPYDIDWSVPRVDESGRKPKVTLDPFMDFKQACMRRDLTINAMGINLHTFELSDPCDGMKNLKDGVLRAPDSNKFIEDPLRFFRVMQFIARFGFKPNEQLNQLCKTMDLSTVSKERIDGECKKWLLKSKKPSLALDWLDSIDRLKDIFPEVAALKGVKQSPQWHPEGDVFEHTKQCLDAAAQQEYSDDNQKLILMYAALCHDLGKAVVFSMNEEGSIISYGHEHESEWLAKQLLRRIITNKELIGKVAQLVDLHMMPGQLVKQGATMSAYKRLARKLSPHLTMNMLAQLFMIDRLGRNSKRGTPLKKADGEVTLFIEKMKQAQVVNKPEEPLLKGRDLLAYFEPGQELGDALKAAYEFQIENNSKDKKEIKRFILQKYQKSLKGVD